jgi:hypothetical protein
LWKPVRVQDTDWCFSGRSQSAPTMISTPPTCHQADTLESLETRLTPNALSRAWMPMMTTNNRNVPTALASTPQTRLANAMQVDAQP